MPQFFNSLGLVVAGNGRSSAESALDTPIRHDRPGYRPFRLCWFMATMGLGRSSMLPSAFIQRLVRVCWSRFIKGP